MAFDSTPTTWLPNWSEDGTSITVPLATFPRLTAAEADAVDGDIRKIVFALVDQLVSAFLATAADDRPGKMTLSRQTLPDDLTGAVRRVYQFAFDLDTIDEEVADEEE